MRIEFIDELIGKSFLWMILIIVLALIVLIGLFFLFRAITCWYFKINKHVKALNAINANLERIAVALEQNKVIVPQQTVPAPVSPAPVSPAPAVSPTPAPVVEPVLAETPAFTVSAPVAAPERKCASCGSVLKEGAVFCVNCGSKVGPEA